MTNLNRLSILIESRTLEIGALVGERHLNQVTPSEMDGVTKFEFVVQVQLGTPALASRYEMAIRAFTETTCGFIITVDLYRVLISASAFSGLS